MMASQNIVVFTGDLTYSVRRGISEMDRAIPGLSWLTDFLFKCVGLR